MKTLCFENFKGGCGKTTSAVNVAVGLLNRNKRVLFIDLDPQANATSNFIEDTSGVGDHAVTMLLHPQSIAEHIVTASIGNLHIDIIPGSRRLSMIDDELKSLANGHYQLSKALCLVEKRYDYVIIDCPPADNMLVFNALVAADVAVIPMKTDAYSMDGLNAILENIHFINEECSCRIKYKVLLNMVNRNRLEQEINERIKQTVNTYQTSIRYQSKPITSAPLLHQFVVMLPKYLVANEYRSLVEEIIVEESL